jgi:hypothetical protein
MISFKTAFEDVYGSGYSLTQYTGLSAGIPTRQNLYVHSCVFRDVSNTGYGGALSCEGGINRFLAEKSLFIYCITSVNYGGAIYFHNPSSGQCVLSKLCAFSCYSTRTGHSEGQFARIYTKQSDVNYKHLVNDTSVTHTLKVGTEPEEILCRANGNVLYPSVNITNNICFRCPVFGCYSTASGVCSMTYSSIVNNTASGSYGCFWLMDANSLHYIGTCNILNNDQTTSDYGTIIAYGNLLIEDSCILGNNIGKTVFYESYTSCRITVSNCSIDNDNSFGSIVLKNNIENTFTNVLSHIAKQQCYFYFDSYGTLVVETNYPSDSTKNQNSCICKRSIIDLFRIFEIILLLTMIPSHNTSF